MLSRSVYGGIRKTVVAGLFLTTAAFALPAVAQEVTVGVRGGPESIDPHFAPIGTHVSAMRNIYDTLVSRDNNLQTEPGLAVSWGPIDELTWEFKLREGVTFHDGTPFTASDVKFSVERVPTITGITGGLRAYVKRIADTIVVDDLTVHFKTDTPAAGLPADLARVFIVSQKAVEGKESSDFVSGDAAAGTGPFKYVSWEPRGDLVVERNDNYWGGDVPWATVTFKEISNDSARVAALLSGDVDMINYAPPASITRLQREDGITLRVRPETLCRITEFSEHESNGRELDEGERVAVEVLPVLGQSAAAVEPGDGAFDHPTPGLDDEALHPIGSLDDLGLEIGQDAGQGAVKDRALIGAVGEQFPEKGKQTEQGRQQRETAVAILNVGGGDDAVQQQALRIDQNMPLLALDQLAGIEAVAVDASPPFSALFTL